MQISLGIHMKHEMYRKNAEEMKKKNNMAAPTWLSQIHHKGRLLFVKEVTFLVSESLPNLVLQ